MKLQHGRMCVCVCVCVCVCRTRCALCVRPWTALFNMNGPQVNLSPVANIGLLRRSTALLSPAFQTAHTGCSIVERARRSSSCEAPFVREKSLGSSSRTFTAITYGQIYCVALFRFNLLCRFSDCEVSGDVDAA